MWWLTMIEAHGDSEAPLGRILVVEDEPPIRGLVRLHLSLAGFEVEEIGDGTVALERARSARFDLIVLDLMLPGLDGITLCRAIRARGASTATPILMVTARDTEADKVLGLESGADDYLTKPFGVRERWLSSGRCCDAPTWPERIGIAGFPACAVTRRQAGRRPASGVRPGRTCRDDETRIRPAFISWPHGLASYSSRAALLATVGVAIRTSRNGRWTRLSAASGARLSATRTTLS